MFNGTKRHAKIKLPKPVVGVNHPFRNPKNHKLLLEYVQQRLMEGKEFRDARLARLVSADKKVAGWMRHTDEDQARVNKMESTGQPQGVTMNLPLSFVHLDDMMTYFATTFAPNRGMFYHSATPDDTSEATQIVTLMNNHAIYAGYFREVLLTILSILKYNSGGFHVAWSSDMGPKLQKSANGTDEVVEETRWQGNRLEAIDLYNFFYDNTVHPTKLHQDGEYAAMVTRRSQYWLQEKASRGLFYNCESALAAGEKTGEFTYYRNPPQEAHLDSGHASRGGVDWVGILTQRDSMATGDHELATVYIRLNPTEFGLIDGNASSRDHYELWRFTVLNNATIVDATFMSNIHGFIPCFMGVINDDLMGTSQKSWAEVLSPLQDFASFLLNTHVYATRKNIWGLTAYDPSAIDLKSIPEGEVSARIPLKPAAQGKDIRQFIWEASGTLDTKQTMQDMEGVMNLINQFFPTQALPSQIASIDRAVDSQVAAVTQGANRRQQKAARLLDDTLFRNMRFAMYYNIIQYQPETSEVMDFFTGKTVQIDLNALRNTNLPYIIGQGLKAIDRQAAVSMMQQIIFALIQAPQAAQGIDILGLIDYWTSMMDVDVNMKQFVIQQPAVDPNAPVDPTAAGAAEGIAPATNPQAITAPIYAAGAE